ncbi:hypothetical protein ACS0TY_021292 [Phlomoides rotata]
MIVEKKQQLFSALWMRLPSARNAMIETIMKINLRASKPTSPSVILSLMNHRAVRFARKDNH